MRTFDQLPDWLQHAIENRDTSEEAQAVELGMQMVSACVTSEQILASRAARGIPLTPLMKAAMEQADRFHAVLGLVTQALAEQDNQE